jgi:hypothetical protein
MEIPNGLETVLEAALNGYLDLYHDLNDLDSADLLDNLLATIQGFTPPEPRPWQ